MLDLGNGLILDGYGIIAEGAKDRDGNVYQPFVINDSGAAGVYGFVLLNSNAAFYLYKELDLIEGFYHDISGTRSPAKGTVYVTPVQSINNDRFGESIIEGAIASTETNTDGKFEFLAVDGSVGKVVIWSKMPFSIGAINATLTCEMTMPPAGGGESGGESGGGGEGGGEVTTPKYLVYKQIDVSPNGACPLCNGGGCTNCGSGTLTLYTNNGVSISGTCPPDMTAIYICEGAWTGSQPSGRGGYTYEVIDGHFSLTPTDPTAALSVVGGGSCCVWGYSNDESGVITIDTWQYSDVGTCLSGDTLISMYDGSCCRLDEIQVGDIVVSHDGTPTVVESLKRGMFNDHHTLYTFDNGTVIDETHTHRFYNTDQGFWQNLEKWKIGEHAITIEGKETALVDKEVRYDTVEMFGLWTESGSYYANGLLSGLAKCNEPLVANASMEKAIDMMTSFSEYQLLSLLGMGGIMP